jgi:hypothetical protein
LGFLEILESYVIVDNKAVQKMRERIFIENPLMTNQERSRKLISQIHHEVNMSLDGVNTVLLGKLRTLILHRSIKNNNILITYSDIVHSMAELNLPLENTIDSIKTWYELHLRDSDVTVIQLIDYIKVIQVYEEPLKSLDDNTVEENEAFIVSQTNLLNKKRLSIVGILCLSALLSGVFINTSMKQTQDHTLTSPTEVEAQGDLPKANTISFTNAQELLPITTVEAGYFNEITHLKDALSTPGIPDFLRYHPVDRASLQAYLKGRNSVLADSPYFEGIIKVSQEYDIHPLFMFAITGQEQGFVNKNDPNYLKIANNPFNVYTSWRKYNTDIEDATAIAAGTVVTILRKRPENENPFKWVNTRYAEDKNWARGVEMIFNFLIQFEL